MKSLIFFTIVCLSVAEKHLYTGYKVIRVSTRTSDIKDIQNEVDEKELNILSRRQIANLTNFDVLCEPSKCSNFSQLLESRKINYKEIIKDLQRAIDEENPQEDEEWENRGGHKLTWSRYHQYKDIESYMDYLAGTFPNLCRVEVIGKSAEGRKIKLLSITSGGDNKPAIWIDGGLHAREWISPASATYIQQQLVELRDNHEQLLQKYDWYILPVANPDGYEYTRNKDRLWRKSRHRYQSCVGVDLNRNFGYQWKSSRGCRREDYSGPSPFSEPETRAIRDYILAHKNIKAYISLHSYSQMWLIPWGYTDEKPKDYYEIYLPAEKAVEAIKKVRGTEYLLGTPAELLYTSQGSSDDWAKGSAGIDYAYTIELPDTGDYGFVLPSSQIKPVGHELWTGIKAFAESLPL